MEELERYLERVTDPVLEEMIERQLDMMGDEK